MSRRLLFIPLLVFAYPLAAQPTADNRSQALLEKAHRMVAVDADGCLKTYNAKEIVVCAKFDADRKHRLPFPELAIEPGKPLPRGEIPNGNPEIVQQGRCYITMDERNCFKGVPLMSVAFGGKGGGVSGPAGKLWRVIEDPVPDEDYVKQVQIKKNPAP